MKLELKPTDHPDYVKVHCWLRRKYGKANKCESNICNGLSKSYHWALKSGFDYVKDRNAFMMLCQSCHKHYDMTDSTRRRMSEGKKGSDHPLSKLKEDDVLIIRALDDGSRKYKSNTAQKYKVSYHTIKYILDRKTWKHV